MTRKRKRIKSNKALKQASCLDIVYYILLFVLLTSPFLRGLYFPREMLLFQAVIFLTFAVWIAGELKSHNSGIIEKKVELGALIFVLIYLLSCIKAVNLRSATGEFLEYASFFTLFILASRVKQNDDKKMKNLLTAVIAASVGVALVSIGAASGLISHKGIFTNRIHSTLQYANAAAAYFLSIYFINGSLFLQAENRKTAYILPASGFTLIFSFFFTYSRGGILLAPVMLVLFFVMMPRAYKLDVLKYYTTTILPFTYILIKADTAVSRNSIEALFWYIIGLAVSVAMSAVFCRLESNKSTYKKNRALFMGICTLLAVVLLACSFTGIILPEEEESSALEDDYHGSQTSRLKDINLETKSAAYRIAFYKDALKLFKSYPVIGGGGDAWRSVYPLYQSFGYISQEVHSFPLKVLTETGVVGAAAFLTFLIMLAIKAAGLLTNGESNHRVAVAGATTAMAGILGHSLIDFTLEMNAVAVILWLLFGFINGERDFKNVTAGESQVLTRNSKLNGRIALIISSLLLVISLSYFVGYVYARNGYEAYKKNNLVVADKYFKRAVMFDPLKSSYRLDYAVVLAKLSETTGNKGFFEKALDNFEMSSRLAPYDGNFKRNLALFYIKNGYIEKSLKEIDEVVKLQPYRLENYLTLSQLHLYASQEYSKMGETAKAKEALASLDGLQTLVDEVIKANGEFIPDYHRKNKKPIDEIKRMLFMASTRLENLNN